MLPLLKESTTADRLKLTRDFFYSGALYSFARASYEKATGEVIRESAWIRCRELFLIKMYKTNSILFLVNNQKRCESIASFLCEVESLLQKNNVKLTPSEFFLTENLNLLINISPFWNSSEVCRQIFTIFLHAGVEWFNKKTDMEKTLSSCLYFANTFSLMAAKRFLNGFIYFDSFRKMNYSFGWVKTFTNANSVNFLQPSFGWVKTFTNANSVNFLQPTLSIK